MVDKNLLFRIQAEDAGVEKTFGQISKAASREMGKVEGALDDSLSAGQRVALGLGRMADDIERELGDAQRAASRLGEELGPELRAKLGQAGVDNLIRDLRNAGLEFADIEADAKDLADAVKRLDRVAAKVDVTADADDAKDDIDRVGDELHKLDGEAAKVKIDSSGVDDLVDKLGGLPGPLGDITGALGTGGTVAAGVGAVGAGLLAAGDYAADLALSAKTTADLTGATVEDASRLQSVWKLSGADVNDLNDVLLQMNGVLLDSPEIAKQLGVNLKDGKDITERFVEVVQKIDKSTLGAAEKAKLMSAAFGEEGVRQVQTLLSLIDGDLQGALDDVSETSIIDDEEVAKARELKEQTAALKVAFSEAAVSIGQNVMPMLVKALGLVDAIAAGLPGGTSKSLLNPTSDKDIETIERINDGTSEMYDNFTRIFSAAMNAAPAIGEVGDATGDADDKIVPYLEHQAGMIAGQGQLTDSTKFAAGAMGLAAVGLTDLRDRMIEANEESERATELLKEQKAAQDELRDSIRNAADANIAAEDAQRAFTDAALATVEATKEHGESSRETEDAVRNERDAMIEAADAAVRQATEFWKANGATISAKDELDAFNTSLLSNARYATPAAKNAIADYIIQANGIPPEKATDIRAAIVAGDIPRAEQLINDVSRAREAAITADAITDQAERDLNYTARDRTQTITSTIRTNNIAVANGGIIESYAPGGVRGLPDQARIQPPGTLVQWAEPETGGEAFIPLAKNKERRSRDIWAEVGRRQGWIGFADGGITGGASAATAAVAAAAYNITVNNNGRNLTADDLAMAIRQCELSR